MISLCSPVFYRDAAPRICDCIFSRSYEAIAIKHQDRTWNEGVYTMPAINLRTLKGTCEKTADFAGASSNVKQFSQSGISED